MLGTCEERIQALDELYPRWEDRTLWDFFTLSCTRFPRAEFLVYEDRSFCYEEVHRYALVLADKLAALGITAGSHVAVSMTNTPECVALIFALARLGAVKVSVNTGVGVDELRYIIRTAQVEWFICADKALVPALNGIGGLRAVLCTEAKGPGETGFLSWQELLELKNAGMRSAPQVESCGLCDIMFTSGSTARPKGVMMTHDMLVRSGYATARTRRMETGRRICVPIPLFHAFAYVEGLLSAVTVGGALLLFRGRFQVERTLDLMREKRANDIICVSPIMIELLVKGRPLPEEFPSLHAAYWAASCPDWIWDGARRAFGIADISTGYGMTECGSTAAIIRPEDSPELVQRCHGRLKSAGPAAAWPEWDALLELSLQDLETGAAVGPEQEGEILLRGKTITPGYYRDEEATRAAIDEEGWFHTGDIGLLDKQGYLKFLGRTNDMYKINGENVSPQFVEQILSRHEAVNMVEVVGIAHPKHGEVGVAFIDSDIPGAQLEPELRAYARVNLARYQCPCHYIFLRRSGWPRTETGKISKKELRQLALEQLS